MRFDGDAALALEIHGIEHLRFHLARLQRAGQFEKPVGKRGFAVIDVCDHGEIANLLRIQCLSRFDGHVPLRILRSDVLRARADEPVVGVLLEDVRRPP